MKGTIWKKALALALAAVLVTGGVPLQPIAELVGELSLTASAETCCTWDASTQTLTLKGNVDRDTIKYFPSHNSVTVLKVNCEPGTKFPADSSEMFANYYSSCEEIDLSNANTSAVTNMHRMFYLCENLEQVILSDSFDTSNVTDMSEMFFFCWQLSPPDFSKFDTRKVKNMDEMLMYLGGSRETAFALDLSAFKTPALESANQMLFQMEKVSSLNISNMDLTKVIENGNLDRMLNFSSSLTELTLGPKTPITYEMCLSNATVIRQGWVIKGTDIKVSHETGCAVIHAPSSPETYTFQRYTDVANYSLVDPKAATADTEGNIEYYNGADGKCYVKNGSEMTAVSEDDIMIPPAGTYTVTFDSKGGSSVTSQTFTYDGVIPGRKKVVKPADPAKGYDTFKGWYTDEGYTQSYNFDTPVGSSFDLYAKWDKNTVKLTFDANGHGTAPDARTIEMGTAPTEPDAPQEPGYSFGGWFTDKDCTSSFDFSAPMLYNETLYAKWTINEDDFSADGGTYTIKTSGGWNVFCDLILDKTTYDGFKGKTVLLDDDIEITRMAGVDGCDFCGTFDGQKHTITVDLTGTADCCAPFRYFYGGTDSEPVCVKNLKVDGTVSTGYKYGAGIVAACSGTVNITNCENSVVIKSAKYDEGSHGGFVGRQNDGTLTIEGCIFKGKLIGTTVTVKCGGFVGLKDGTVKILNSIYAPAALGEGETEIHSSGSYTFSCPSADEITNCYYTRALGTAQGNKAVVITAGSHVSLSASGTPTKYDVSNINVYEAKLEVNGNFYTLSGQTLTLSHDNIDEHQFIGYTSQYGTINGSTFTADSNDTTINAEYSGDALTHTVTWKNYNGTELEKNENVMGGTVPEYNGEMPERPADDYYTYTFSGWDPTPAAVTQDTEYTAQFTQADRLYTVTWKNYDGTQLEKDEDAKYGDTPEYNGETPVKPADEYCTYTFAGWTPKVSAVTGEAEYMAAYKAVPKYPVEATISTNVGSTWSAPYNCYHNDLTPNNTQTLYTSELLQNIDGCKICSLKYYVRNGEGECDVTGLKIYMLETDESSLTGIVDVKNNENAVKVFDGDYTFSASGDCVIGLTEPFVYNGGNLIISMESSQAGESGDISFSSDYMDYTASYFHYGTWTDNKHFLPQCTFICADEHKYTVTWKNENGDELEKDENVIGGKMPEYNGSTPTKEQDQQHTYTFDKWSPELSPVRADITYTAQFTESVRLYKITWKNYDDSELETDSVPYGETPRYTGEEPEKPDDDFYNYNFTGWDKEPAEVTGDEEYTAEFTAEPKNQLKHTACDTTEYTTSYAPYYSDYNDYYPNETQTLYSKERLSNIKKGSKIYSLAFYMDDSESVSGPLTVPGMKVYLLETDEEDLNTPADYENDPNAVKVFDSDKTIGSTGLTIDFTTPYTYNGGNLVIVICNSRDGWYRNKVFYGDIGDDNQVYYKQGYNVNYSDIIPKCTFGYVDESYYTVTWKNADGTVLEIDENVPAGSLPKYDSEEPNWLEGRVFQGWKPFVTFVSANTTYTAVYNSVVTFDEDNGNTTTKNVDYGEKVSSYVPEKNGYVFAGWYLSDEMFDFGTEIIQDITLTAHWVSESDAKRLTLGGTYFKGDLINFDNQYFVSEPEAADPANYLEYAVVGDWYRRDDRYYVFNDYKGDEILEITNEYYGDNVDVGFKVVSGDGTEEDPYKFAIVPISPGTKHTVTWLDSDGSTVLAADSVVWGDVPVFNGDIDIPEDKILCWSDGESVYSRDDLPFVKGDITYTAVFAVKLEVGTVFKQGDFVEFGKYCFNADDEDGKVSLAADTGVISVYSVSMISRLKQYKIDDDDNISSFKLYVSCDDVIEGDAAVKVVSGSGTEKDPFIFKMISLGEEENTFKVVYRTDEETLYDVLVKGGEAAPDCAVPGEYAAEGFEGWYLDGDYYDLTTPVTSDIILSSYVWGEAAYTWSADNKTCTAKRVDKADVSHVETETVNAASEVTTPAACESMGKTTYTAEFTHKGFTAQTKVLEDVEALGHDWSAAAYTWSDDNKTCTAERVCRNDASHVEKETVNAVITELDASCEDTGKLIYTAEFASNAFAKQTKEFETTPAAGHKWDAPTYTWSADNKTCTAERVCKNDASHVEKETVKTTSKVTTPATCEYKGITTYTAEFANKAFASQKKELPNVAALGHDWSDTTYTWSDDNKTCTAERVCKNNASHTETETVNTTSEATAAATCESKGKTTYTAEFANKAFAKQTKQLENIEALGHDWNDPTCTWNDDCTEATATFTCKNDSSHVHTEAAAVETTENADGTTTHTAAVTFNGKTYTDTKITGASSADSPDEPGKPDTDKPDTDNSDTDNPDTDSPDTDSPDTDSPDTDNSDTDNSDTDNSDTDSPDTDNSDTDNSDTDNSDTDNSDTDNSDTDNSDTDKPNPDKPDPDKPDPEKTGPLGDVNNDGVVDATDALLILRASLGLDTFDDTQSFFGDVDEDGMITSNDALEVLRYSINLPAAEKIGTQAAKKES